MAQRRSRRAGKDEPRRSLGPRARATRERLLEATAALLRERGLRGASVAEIARRAGTSAATFYQYFEDVDAATLELVRRAREAVPALLEEARGSFAGEAGLARARSLATRFFDLWDTHHAVLRIRDHAAEEGDRRFQRERRDAVRPLLEALAAHVRADAGDGLHPMAAASALATVLESAGAHHRALATLGIPREALIETSARLLVDTLA
jgi:AcrR family transcriptional regulator